MTQTADLPWRLTARFESRQHARGVFSALKTHSASALAADRLKDGVVAEREGEWLRIYAASPDALERGQGIVADVAASQGVTAEERAEHRDGAGDGWTEIELPSPPEGREAIISEHQGQGPWGSEAEPARVQAHFELGSRHAAQKFAQELACDGYDVHQAESFVFLFADDADHAHELGNALKERAPEGARLFFEGEGSTIFL